MPDPVPYDPCIELTITAGEVLLYRVLDVADQADLAAAERILRARAHAGGGVGGGVARLALGRQRQAVAFTNPPVVAHLGERVVRVGGRDLPATARTQLYDFGAMTVVWSLPITPGTSLAELAELSADLNEPSLQAEIWGWLDDDASLMVGTIGAALVAPTAPTRPAQRRSGPHAEDLVLYAVRGFDQPVTAEELLADPLLAQLLLGERHTYSKQLIGELHRTSYSYSSSDLVVIGYDQAFVLDEEPGDVAALLEFSLAQVLELEGYDALLDERLAQMTDTISSRRAQVGQFGIGRSRFETTRRDLLLQHVDLTEVLERVTSSVKVTEDLYYAKIYRGALDLFGAAELITSTDRKLELMFRTYTMLADEVDSHTTHRLEWIVILLIGFEIVITLIEKIWR